MQNRSRLRSVMAFIPLILALTLTWHSQSLWAAYNFIEALFLVILWPVLIIGWLIRQGQRYHLKGKFSPIASDISLPLALLFVFICVKTHLPLRVLFWSHKGALENALNRPILHRREKGQSIGLLYPLQISKSGQATRILFFEERSFLSGGTIIGFAHCPRNKRWRGVSFESYYTFGDYTHETLQLSDDWIAISLSGSDFE